MNALSLFTTIMSKQESSFAGQFSTASAAKAYILAGHATITLESKKTGSRFTYKIKRQNQIAFVSVLRGPENTTDYAYLGAIFLGPSRNGDFRVTAKSTISSSAPSAQAFAWAWKRLYAGHLPETLNVWHEGTCGRCGRALTVPESISSGLGPICASKG
jgi:uncharacterized protein DUF6011